MRLFLFKILFKITWWVAPNTPRVNRIFNMYLEEVKKEEDFVKCQKRQAEMDTCIQPRTETYEYLTCAKQRKVFEPLMPPRFHEKDQPRSHYSDYEEAKAYHEGL